MEKTEINLIPDQNGKVQIEQRTGDLPKPIEITDVTYCTTINAPYLFLNHFEDIVVIEGEPKEPSRHMTVVSYSYDSTFIKVETRPGHPQQKIVTGELAVSQAIKRFGINTDKKFDRKGLMKTLKFNRRFFESLEENGNLVAKLSNLEIKANQEIKKADDERGNIAFQYEQLVSSELPESFEIKIPVFVGTAPRNIPVDLRFNVTGSQVEFWLESPELETIMEEMAIELIDTEITKIQDIGFLCLELS